MCDTKRGCRTTSKEPTMKFYEMPESAIAESLRQISFKVAIAVLEQRSSTVTLHTKTNLRRMSGQHTCYTVIPGVRTDKTGSKKGYGGSEEHSYKSCRGKAPRSGMRFEELVFFCRNLIICFMLVGKVLALFVIRPIFCHARFFCL